MKWQMIDCIYWQIKNYIQLLWSTKKSHFVKNLADNDHNTVMTRPEVYVGPCQGPNYTPATSRDYVVLYFLTHFSSMLHSIKKPVFWFVTPSKWLVSVSNVTMGWNGLWAILTLCGKDSKSRNVCLWNNVTIIISIFRSHSDTITWFIIPVSKNVFPTPRLWWAKHVQRQPLNR